MKNLQSVLLVLLAAGAVWFDLREGRIPNGLILAGLGAGFVWQTIARGPAGILFFLGGVGLPVVFLWGLFFFRMIGAGDIKLLAAAGGLLGIGGSALCAAWAVGAGAVYALAFLVWRGELKKRLWYFWAYVYRYAQTREWKPYICGENVDSHFCFSVPVLISICFYVGGAY